MTVTPSLIRAEYLEFDSLSDEQIQLQIDDASEEITESYWGKMRDRAIRAKVAHELAVKYHHQLQLGTVLKAIKTGQSLDSFLLGSDEYYQLTPYGKKYLQLRAENPKVGMVI